MISTILLSVGVISGLALNAIHHSRGTPALPWHDPVVWSSGLLLAWLVLAAAFNLVYRPARHGRKVAYLTMASMLFLLLALGVILLVPSQHPSQQGTTRAGAAGPAAERSKAVSQWHQAGGPATRLQQVSREGSQA
jgi:hypothetical protein